MSLSHVFKIAGETIYRENAFTEVTLVKLLWLLIAEPAYKSTFAWKSLVATRSIVPKTT